MAKPGLVKQYDLTQGPILNRLLLVAVPVMGTQLMMTFYNLTDMFWLGRVGSAAVAASGTAGMFLWLSQAFLIFGRMGAEIGVAQSLGARDEDAAKRYSQTSLLLAILLGIGFGAAMVLFRRPLVGIFNIQEASVARDTELYLAVVSIGIPLSFVTAALCGAFTGSGNSRTPFFINAAGLALNILLDPLLIFTAGWGVVGAAVATVAAQAVVCLLALIAIKRDPGRPFAHYRYFTRPERKMVAQVFRWSTPIAVESLLFTLMSTVISRFINGFGTAAMAVQRVGSQIESLSWQIGGGFASAVTAFVGQNYGARRWARIWRGARVSTLSMAVWGCAVTLVLALGGGVLFGLFLPGQEELIAMGAQYMRILAVCQLVACLEYNSSGVFRGVGRTLPSSIVTTGGNLIRIPIVFFLGGRFGLTGIWWGITLGAFLRSIWMIAWFLLMMRQLPHDDEPAQA